MTSPFEVEEFWEDLLAFIEDRRVIPIVGAELLIIEEGGQSVSLYRAVAERLLNKYGLSENALPGGYALREHHELNDAVCALATTGRRVRDLYRLLARSCTSCWWNRKKLSLRYGSWPRSSTLICSPPPLPMTSWRAPWMQSAST